MVTVSAAEVSNHVASGKVKILAVMSDQRLPSFDKVPTLKEKGIDLSVGTWRGIVVTKKAPKDAQDALRAAAAKVVEDADYKAALIKMNMTYAYQDAAAFQKAIDTDNVSFKTLMTKLGMAK
jgi:tripartite-type tricarboxylate transporter receptor subunit TctC